MDKVAIIGLGMMGTSIGLALQKAWGGKKKITGYDADQSTQKKAEKLGAVDQTAWLLRDVVEDADLAFIATPSIKAYSLLESLGQSMKSGSVVSDVTNSNRPITEWAGDLLPRGISFVSGNPLAGNNISGQLHAREDLFKDNWWVLSPKADVSPHAVSTVREVVAATGAKPLFMDIDEHDSFTAAIAGLPTAIAIALITSLGDEPSWHEMFRFIGIEFDAVTKPAAKDPVFAVGDLALNGDMVAHWIDRFIENLKRIKDSLLNYEESLDPEGFWANSAVQAWEKRVRVDAGVSSEESQRVALPTASQAMTSFLLGEAAYKGIARLQKNKRDPMTYNREKLL